MQASIRNRYVESAAYHEAAHIVVGAVQEMPLRHRGIHIDPIGCGIAYYWHKTPGTDGTVVERQRTIISTAAGYIAQEKYYPKCPDAGAYGDQEKVEALLDELHPEGGSACLRPGTLCTLRKSAAPCSLITTSLSES